MFKNLVRDWAEEGAPERAASYGRILAELAAHFPRAAAARPAAAADGAHGFSAPHPEGHHEGVPDTACRTARYTHTWASAGPTVPAAKCVSRGGPLHPHLTIMEQGCHALRLVKGSQLKLQRILRIAHGVWWKPGSFTCPAACFRAALLPVHFEGIRQR